MGNRESGAGQGGQKSEWHICSKPAPRCKGRTASRWRACNNNTGKSIIYPIYTGHFQPSDWAPKFADIASTLNLYGWSSYNIFIAANNSNYDIGGNANGKKNAYAFQGIVAGQRDSDGDIVMNGTTLKEPHFNEKFLTGQNSKNAKLGKVYHNVEFPFTQKEVFVESDQKGKGVKCF